MTDSKRPELAWPGIFAEHRRYLWSVCYRLTGDVCDAEDLVQATFERAMRNPPRDRSRPWRPWLTRVATNLAIDLLRHRSQHAYTGPWLPAPVEELLEVEGWTRDQQGLGPGGPETEVRYAQLESARLAFLLALEALDPRARAVLILRDVLGYTGPEVGEFLDESPANIRVILHRARKRLEAARREDAPSLPRAQRDARMREAIERFMSAIASGDAEALGALLCAEVRATTDSAGEFVAARKVVSRRDAVVALLLGIAKQAPLWTDLRRINDELGVVVALPPTPLRTASHAVLHLELDGEGKIREVQVQLAPRKLAAISLEAGATSSGAAGREFA